MTFKKDLAASEWAVYKTELLLKKRGLTELKRIGSGFIKNARRDQERMYGDLSATQKGKTVYFEVKSYARMEKTKRIFLETLSDDGSVTGNITKGWIDYTDEETKVDVYVFYANDNPSKSISVRRSELLAMLNKLRAAYPVRAMQSNQTQKNRSQGLVVPVADIMHHCKSAQYINLS